MKVTFLESLGLSALGISIVFAMLVIIMAVIMLLTRITRLREDKKTEGTDKTAPAPAVAQEIPAQDIRSAKEAPGSAGVIKLYDVPEKQAAMVMAIVAHHLKTPLNRLRFKSIKRID